LLSHARKPRGGSSNATFTRSSFAELSNPTLVSTTAWAVSWFD